VHFSQTDTFYLDEAFQRIHFYLPPWAGLYIPPWLWYDGDPHGGYDYTLWESIIVSRMAQPSPVTLKIWGDYNSSTGSGTVYVQFRNDSTAALNGIALIVITEDSLYYEAPNGVNWHNHVPRDYLPDHNGVPVSVAPGDSTVVSQSFTISPDWNDERCSIVTWIQDTVMQADSTFEIWQGGLVKVAELGIFEEEDDYGVSAEIMVEPNPCKDIVNFSFDIPTGSDYRINIFDVTGRCVQTLDGKAGQISERILWNCRDKRGIPVNSGVYFYKLQSGYLNATGKIVKR